MMMTGIVAQSVRARTTRMDAAPRNAQCDHDEQARGPRTLSLKENEA